MIRSSRTTKSVTDRRGREVLLIGRKKTVYIDDTLIVQNGKLTSHALKLGWSYIRD